MTKPDSEHVLVRVVSAKRDPETRVTTVNYEIQNRANIPIWIVKDPWFVWKLTGDLAVVSFARGKMMPGAAPFGYFRPELEQLPPQGTIERSLELRWPLRLSTLWNPETTADEPAVPYRLIVEIGYGLDDKGAVDVESGSVEDGVLCWQQRAKSTPIIIR